MLTEQNWVVWRHTGTRFHYSGFRENWNQVPLFDNFSEYWEIVPLFGEIPNTGTKFQYDALAQLSEYWNQKNIGEPKLRLIFFY